MRRPLVALLFAIALASCGPPGGAKFIRAYAAGDRAYSSGRYLEAAEAYEEAAKTASRDRDHDEALYSAGVARERAGDLAGALKHFDALAAENPPGERAVRAAFRAAHIRIEQGDEKRGFADLEKIILRAPEHGVTRRALQAVVGKIEETDGKAAAIAWEEKLYPAVAKTRLGEELCYDLAHRREAAGEERAALAGFLSCADQYPYPKGALWDDSLWHASRLHEKLGDPKAAIAALERMLAAREPSYMSGSYNRPRMAAAQFRIAVLQRDLLKDPAAARASFHKVYVEHTTSILRPRALFEEAKLAAESGDGSSACSLGEKLIAEFADTRWARNADEACPQLAAKAGELRKKRAEKRAKGKPTDDD
ncbi:MAG: tetratricopeptide repeat protein [Deltaproteobacteria bacterium]|nr:tetratricopeptide repeat protein [Deltaproteobacteria bacterium]